MPSFADIDGDGDLNAFVGNDTGSTPCYGNTGSTGWRTAFVGECGR